MLLEALDFILPPAHWAVKPLYLLLLLLLLSVTQSCPTLCSSMDLQHARFPCPSPSPRVCSNAYPSVMPSNHLILSSASPPTFSLSQHQGLFQWVGSSHQVAKVLELQFQHQFFQWIFSESESHSVMSDSLWPHGLQHARLFCPSLSPRVYSDSCPLSWWCYPTISSSVTPFSFASVFPSIKVFSNKFVTFLKG